MFVMDELWAGKLCPSETAVHTGSEYRQLCRQLADKAEALHENMNDRDWELFEEYEEIFYSREAFIKKSSFISGFRLGVLIMLDTLGNEPIPASVKKQRTAQ